MTKRPSYEYNLYVDNAHNVSAFFQETLAEVAKYRPAAILIDNRALNQTEDSRFHNWAAETYEMDQVQLCLRWHISAPGDLLAA